MSDQDRVNRRELDLMRSEWVRLRRDILQRLKRVELWIKQQESRQQESRQQESRQQESRQQESRQQESRQQESRQRKR